MLLTVAPAPTRSTLDARLGGIRLEELGSFLVLSEVLNFGQAARVLFLSAGALSRQIGHLEGALGAPLFSRTTRQITLTPFGESFIDTARSLLAELTIACRLGSSMSA